jgi:hypothetical protein
MRLNFRNPVVFSVLLAMFFTGSLLRAQENQPGKTRASAIQVMMIRADGIPATRGVPGVPL